MKKKSHSKQKTALWNKVGKVLQDYYRSQRLHCFGKSKSCTGEATVMHHWHTWGNCKALRLHHKNLVPLCKNCHASVHTFHAETVYNIRKNMEADYGLDWEKQLLDIIRLAPIIKGKEETELLKGTISDLTLIK